MAAGKDEPETIVFKRQCLLLKRRIGLVRQAAHGLIRIAPVFPTLLSAKRVNCLVASGGNQPCAWIGRSALLRPLLKRNRKRLLRCFLGEIEAAQ